MKSWALARVHATCSRHLKVITYFVPILVDFDILTLAFHALFLTNHKQLLQPLLRFFEPVAGVSFEEKSSLFSRGVKRGMRIDVEVLIFVHHFLTEESYFSNVSIFLTCWTM